MLAFCWTLLLYTLIGSYSERGRLVHAGYPYSSDDMSMRQEQLLEKLRGDMSLVVNEEIVPRELRNPTLGDFLMRNMEVCDERSNR